MEESLRGKLLIASPALVDPNFARSVVLDHRAQRRRARWASSSTGPSETAVGDVVPAARAVSAVADEPIYVGGPVQPQALVVLAEFADLDAAAWIVVADVGFVAADASGTELAGGPAGEGLRRLFGVGGGPARGASSRGVVDRRAAAAAELFPDDPLALWRTYWPARAASTR